MKKIFKTLIPMVGILAISAPLLWFTAKEVKSLNKSLLGLENKITEAKYALNTITPVEVFSLNNASLTLKEGFKQYSMFYLEKALGKENVEIKQKVTLDELAETAGAIVDKHGKNSNAYKYLLNFAYTLYEEQKKEMARNTLKDELEENNLNFFTRLFKMHDYTAINIWLVYNLDLNKTKSIKKTHENVRENYKHELIYPYVDEVLIRVEKAIPEGDSELIKKIENY